MKSILVVSYIPTGTPSAVVSSFPAPYTSGIHLPRDDQMVPYVHVGYIAAVLAAIKATAVLRAFVDSKGMAGMLRQTKRKLNISF